MSPMQITTEPTTEVRRPQSHYDSKARQARSDFLAETFHALCRSILEDRANRIGDTRSRPYVVLAKETTSTYTKEQ